MAAGLLVLCGCGAIGLPADTGVDSPLKVAVRQPLTFDPALARDPAAVLIGRQIFQPLVQFDRKRLTLLPGAAESWNALDGATRFMFKLRRGARFHNGQPVQAEDAVFALNRLASPGARSDLAFLLDTVVGYKEFKEDQTAASLAGVSAPDSSTVEIRLTSPWDEFPYALTHPSTAPLPRGIDPAQFKDSPVGSGPYRVTGPVTPGDDIVLERFEGFKPKPALDSARLLVYESGEQWKDFESGLVDIAEVPVGRLSAARNKYGSAGITPGAAGVFLGFNLAKLPDPALRRAISNAINRKAIAEEVYGGLLAAGDSLIPPGLPGHTASSCGKLCAFDPESARSVIQGLQSQGAVPAMGLDYQEGPAQEKLSMTIQSQVLDAGIRLDLRPYALPDFFKTLQEGRHDLFRLGWAADYPLADWFLSPLLQSGSADNYTGFSDPQVDQWITSARAETDPVKRRRLYRAIERRAIDSAVITPVGFLLNHWAAAGRVKGFYVDAIGGFQISRLSLGPE